MKSFSFVLLLVLSVFQVSKAQSPGNVSGGLRLWLKANNGVSGSAPVSAWLDQSSLNNHPVINGNPTLNTSALNYNPSILLDGNGDFFSWSNLTNGFTQGEVFSLHTLIASAPSNPNGELWDWNSTSFGGSGHTYIDNNFYDDFGADNGMANTLGSVPFLNRTSQFIYNSNCGGANSNMSCYIQGQFIASQFLTTSGFSPGVMIGKGNFPGAKELNARMGEIILYNTVLSTANRQKIWSYLAVKYGITLRNTSGLGDYTGSNGSIIWAAATNPSYHNDVIGIGRDDNQALLQKQSHSISDSSRIYVSAIVGTNILNTGSISNNNSYVLMGKNSGKTCASLASNTEVPVSCGMYSRIEREWKITNTNFTQVFNIDLKLNSCANLTSVNIANLKLLVDDDGNFSNGGTNCYYNGDGTGISISYSNPVITITGISNVHVAANTTRYFTIGSGSSSTPLPITLTFFNAIAKSEGSVELTWQTEREINIDYFTVERSVDANNWQTVLRTKDLNNTNFIKNYYEVDPDPYKNISYYRLKEIDLNGESTYSEVKEVNIISRPTEIKVYPNPTKKQITIEYNKPGVYEIELLNYLGESLVRTKESITESDNTSYLDLSYLPTGIYYLRMNNEVRKLIKE